jgi:hypothetical protein
MYIAEIEGLTQTISFICDAPISDSLSILVNFESRNGICVLLCEVSAEIQCPSLERLPLIDFN